MKAFNDYLTYGGFPFLLSLESEIDKTEYLNDIFNSIFLKDIIERYSIRDAGLLTRIVDFILDNTGKMHQREATKDFSPTIPWEEGSLIRFDDFRRIWF